MNSTTKTGLTEGFMWLVLVLFIWGLISLANGSVVTTPGVESKSDGAIRLGNSASSYIEFNTPVTSLPTCDATNEGRVAYYKPADTGTLQLCKEDTADTYSWGAL